MLTIDDIQIEVIRKDIKHIRLQVLSPDGRVRISAPHHVEDDRLKSFALSKLGWIKKYQGQFKEQPVLQPYEYVTGEVHYYQGDRYTLQVVEQSGKPQVQITNNHCLVLSVGPHSSPEQRAQILNGWYRDQLKLVIPPLLAKWEPIIGVNAKEWRIKAMKTRWGTCNIQAQRIWLNLELIKKPSICLEYVLVHELVHLLERYHNARFKAYMTNFMPDWPAHKALLNQTGQCHTKS
jgi:predicted metal-dependent hydrolase